MNKSNKVRTAEIQQIFSNIKNSSKTYARDGVVRSVDLTTKTAQVELLSSKFDINDVKGTITCKLSANRNGSFYLIPVIGSDVVVSFEDINVAYISLYSDVENVAWTSNAGASLTLDEKITIRNNDVSMKDILIDLMDLLKFFKVITTGTPGPSTTVEVSTYQAIEQLELKINLLLK